MPFYVDSTNEAGLNYKGARFDNIIAVSDDEYQIYVYCHRNLILAKLDAQFISWQEMMLLLPDFGLTF